MKRMFQRIIETFNTRFAADNDEKNPLESDDNSSSNSQNNNNDYNQRFYVNKIGFFNFFLIINRHSLNL